MEHVGTYISQRGIGAKDRLLAKDAITKFGATPLLVRKLIREEAQELGKRVRPIPDLKQVQNYSKHLRKSLDNNIKTIADLETW